MDSQSGRKLGPYRLVSRLAAGGMGEVYVGVRHGIGQFQKPMAVKLLLPHLTLKPKAVQRFLDEARISARMTHPNVAQVFDVGFVDDRYYLVMELVRGASLSSLIAALGQAGEPASAELICHVGRALSEGLHHAHELTDSDGTVLEVVHRDVTPHNVLVSIDGAVKVTDFGVARMRDGSAETSPGAVLGKLAYMAPEQLRGLAVDRRADVFGVGATLFHLATLAPPFGTPGNDLSTLRALETGELPDLAALRPDLPIGLRTTLLRCLARAAADRFPTAKELRDALPPAPGGEELLARLVKKHCAATVQRVDELTLQPDEGTESLPNGPATLHTSRVVQIRRPWPVVALGLGVAAALILGFFFVGRTEQEVLPPPEIASAKTQPPLATPTPVAPEPQPAATRPAPQRRPRAPAASPLPPAPVALGFLSIDARPWASVFVDGQKVGDTPLAALPVESGRHLVRLVNPETGKQHEERVMVKPGEKTFLKADLR